MHLFFREYRFVVRQHYGPSVIPHARHSQTKRTKRKPPKIQSKEIGKEIKYISYKDYPQVKGETRRNIMVVYNSFFPSPDKISGTKKAEP